MRIQPLYLPTGRERAGGATSDFRPSSVSVAINYVHDRSLIRSLAPPPCDTLGNF